MHSLEMLQRLNSAAVVDRERRRAIIMNNPKGHPKDEEKGRRKEKFRHWSDDPKNNGIA